MHTELSIFEQRLRRLRAAGRSALDLTGPLGDDPLAPQGEIRAVVSGDQAANLARSAEDRKANKAGWQIQDGTKLVIDRGKRDAEMQRARRENPQAPDPQAFRIPIEISGGNYELYARYIEEALRVFAESPKYFEAFGSQARATLFKMLDLLGAKQGGDGGKKEGKAPGDVAEKYKLVMGRLNGPGLVGKLQLPPRIKSMRDHIVTTIYRSIYNNETKVVTKMDANTVKNRIRDLVNAYDKFTNEFAGIVDTGSVGDLADLLAKYGLNEPIAERRKVRAAGRRKLDLTGPLGDDPLAPQGEIKGPEDPDTRYKSLSDEIDGLVAGQQSFAAQSRTGRLVPQAVQSASVSQDPEAKAAAGEEASQSGIAGRDVEGFTIKYPRGPSFDNLHAAVVGVLAEGESKTAHKQLSRFFEAYFNSGYLIKIEERLQRLKRGVRLLEDDPDEVPFEDFAVARQRRLAAQADSPFGDPITRAVLGRGDQEITPEADIETEETPADTDTVVAKSSELAEHAAHAVEDKWLGSPPEQFKPSDLEAVIEDAIGTELGLTSSPSDTAEDGPPVIMPGMQTAAPESDPQALGPGELSKEKSYYNWESMRLINRLAEAFLHDAEVMQKGGDLLFEAAPPAVPVRAFGGGLIDPDIAQEVDDPELAHQLTRWHQLAQAKVALEQQLKKLMVDLQTGEVFDPNTPSAAMVNAPAPGGMKAALAARRDRGVVASDIINAIGQLYAQMEPALKAMGDTQVRVDNVLFRLKQRERRTAAWRSVTKAMSKEVRDLAAQSVEEIPARFQARREAVKTAMDKLLGGMEKFLEPVQEMLEKAYMLAAEERVVTRQYTDINPEVLLPQEESLLQEVLGEIGRFLGNIFSGIAGLFQRMWQGKKEVDAAVVELVTIEEFEFDDGSRLTLTNGNPRMYFPPGHPFWDNSDEKGAANG